MEENKRCPSKYSPEERTLWNWVKYVKKRKARGLLSEEQARRFDDLQKMAGKVRRLNQYAYGCPEDKRPEVNEELSLF